MSHQSKFCFLFFKSKKNSWNIRGIIFGQWKQKRAGWLFLVLIPFMVGRINLLLSPEFFFVAGKLTYHQDLHFYPLKKKGQRSRRRGASEKTQVHDGVGKTGKKKGVSFLQIRTHTKKLCELRKWTRVVKMPKTSPHLLLFTTLHFIAQYSVFISNSLTNKKLVNEVMKKLPMLDNNSIYEQIIIKKYLNFCAENQP